MGQKINSVQSGVPTGATLPFAGTTAPAGWLTCDGSAISRTTYAALFAAIGTAWGSGNGSTTFNIPDMRRKTAVGSGGTSTSALGNAVGNTGGAETHTLTTGEMPAHDHDNNTNSWTANASLASGSGGAGWKGGTPVMKTSSTGGGGAHNNLQPSAVVNYIIKT